MAENYTPRVKKILTWRPVAEPLAIQDDAGPGFEHAPAEISEPPPPADGPRVVAVVVSTVRHKPRR